MFWSNKNEDTNKKTAVFEFSNIPVHTMEDDLNVLTGKNNVQEDKASPAEKIEQAKQLAIATEEKHASSPFLQEIKPTQETNNQIKTETPPPSTDIKITPKEKPIEIIAPQPIKPEIKEEVKISFFPEKKPPIPPAPKEKSAPIQEKIGFFDTKKPAQKNNYLEFDQQISSSMENIFSPVQKKESVAKELPIKEKVISPQKETSPQAPKSENISKAPTNWNKIVTTSIIFFAVALSAFAGYYYYITKKVEVETTQNTSQTIEDNKPTDPTPTIEINPDTDNQTDNDDSKNLIIDTEKLSTAEIWDLIKNKSSQAKNINNENKIQEFFIVDNKNNPIDFSRFTKIAALTFPQNILDNLEEQFSFFSYSDKTDIRIGLSVKIKNSARLQELMLKSEKSLPTSLKPMLYEAKLEKKEVMFNNSQYQNYPVRYFNLDKDNLFSIDYIITDNELIIGTSMQSTRAIYDHIHSQSEPQKP